MFSHEIVIKKTINSKIKGKMAKKSEKIGISRKIGKIGILSENRKA